MARYRIGENPDAVSTLDANDSPLIVGTAVFGLATGIGFVIAGLRARIYWLVFWGAGLVLASLAYLLHRFFL